MGQRLTSGRLVGLRSDKEIKRAKRTEAWQDTGSETAPEMKKQKRREEKANEEKREKRKVERELPSGDGRGRTGGTRLWGTRVERVWLVLAGGK